jgi:flavin reductase (DIM6/NTAB) family NADH-FMN oxidoreductase RutF
MTISNIAWKEFNSNIFTLFNDRWFVLTGGDFASDHFNSMVISWGSAGILWNRPIVQVFVRPTRYTFEFMEKYDSFTVSVLPTQYRPVLNLLGARSGRDVDKMALTRLTPVASTHVAAPSLAEAELVLETRKIYWADFEPSHFIDPEIDKNYAKKDYHRIYIGEVLAVLGEVSYRHPLG